MWVKTSGLLTCLPSGLENKSLFDEWCKNTNLFDEWCRIQTCLTSGWYWAGFNAVPVWNTCLLTRKKKITFKYDKVICEETKCRGFHSGVFFFSWEWSPCKYHLSHLSQRTMRDGLKMLMWSVKNNFHWPHTTVVINNTHLCHQHTLTSLF